MTVFTSSEMKREFYELVEKILPSLNECGNCNVFKCAYCFKFSVNWQSCRLSRCKNCTDFHRSKEILTNNCDDYSKEYVANFLTDYFKISDVTADFLNLSISSSTVKEKKIFFLSEKTIIKKTLIMFKNLIMKLIILLREENTVFSVDFFVIFSDL